ncbi:hypothetical protein [Aeromicrobium sp. Sec7.5]|uniref:hypothetical protein n=1 Tax=Aeromicrobium sp. Sec7.5 TaxID=3121276 RepID=UPI002FE43F57
MPMRRRPPWARFALRANAVVLAVCAAAGAFGAFVSVRGGELGTFLACAAVTVLTVCGALAAVRESEK